MSKASNQATSAPALTMVPDDAVNPLLEELRGLQTEIRAANRGEPIRAIAGLGVALSVVFTPGASQQLVLLVAPLLLGGLATYQINSAVEVAAIAEYRDRLAAILNEKLGYSVFNERRIQNW